MADQPPKRKRKPSRPPPPDVDPYLEKGERAPRVRQVVRLRALAEGEQVLGASSNQTRQLYLRNWAGTLYATSRDEISISELAKTPPFDEVTVARLGRWRVWDDWDGRRARFWESTMQRVEAKIRDHVSAEKIRQLKYMDYLLEKLAIAMDGTPPKSLEGLATAMTKVLAMSNQLRDQVAGQAVGVLGGGREGQEGDGDETTDGLTDEEVRAFALAVAQQRKELPTGPTTQDEESDVGDEE